MSILIIAIGINVFHPKCINWSKRNLGIVQRIHMNTKMKKNIFAKNAPTHSTAKRLPLNASIPGKLYPPKNNMAIKADEINIATYSENKNNPNFGDKIDVS